MLKIRLSRFGRKACPFYRIVVVDARKQRDSSFISEVGKYDPINNMLRFNVEEYQKYISFGAQTTNTVNRLFLTYNKSQVKK